MTSFSGQSMRRSLVAAFGVRFFAYQWDKDGNARWGGRPVRGLSVRVVGDTTLQPRWHGTTGVYGFASAPPGEYRLHVYDPSRRYLPRAVEVEVPDALVQWREEIEEGIVDALPADYDPVRDVAVYPSPGYPRQGAQTILRGTVIDGGVRIALGRVVIDDPGGSEYSVVGYADARGDWAVNLHRLKPAAGAPPGTWGEVTRRVRLFALESAMVDEDPVAAFPARFDELSGGDADDLYEFLEEDEITIQVGKDNRYE